MHTLCVCACGWVGIYLYTGWLIDMEAVINRAEREIMFGRDLIVLCSWAERLKKIKIKDVSLEFDTLIKENWRREAKGLSDMDRWEEGSVA